MMRLSKMLKTTALAGLFGLGLVAASPALADRAYTRCNNDGDRCVRVVCDRDGDDCRRYPIRTGWDGYRRDNAWRHDDWRHDDWRRYDRDGYREGWYRREHVDRRWVCDRGGDYCRWTERRW